MSHSRLKRLNDHIIKGNLKLHYCGNNTLCIGCGDEILCTLDCPSALRPDLVPHGYIDHFRQDDGEFSQIFLQVVLFLMKKDLLGQDTFLLGPPGMTRRTLVMAFCELTHREVELACISQDTTVSDIKQRREIRSGSALFCDGPAVRAALHGRILILDGIEKAERNTLSVLNNLLENREMHLEDGRFLCNPSRFENLGEFYPQETLQDMLVPINARFRTIALGVPVPEYDGYTIDPPFRSRFQCCVVPSIVPNIEILEKIRTALRVAEYTGLDGVSNKSLRRTEFPAEYHIVRRILTHFPNLSMKHIIAMIYPFPMFATYDALQKQLLIEILIRYGILRNDSIPLKSLEDKANSSTHVHEQGRRPTFREQRQEALRREDVGMGQEQGMLRLAILDDVYTSSCGLDMVRGAEYSPAFVNIPYHCELLNRMLMLHQCGLHFTLIGKRGCGKSSLVREFAQLVHSSITYFPLWKDMSAHDLLQKRTTLPNGDTVWMPSPLLRTCLQGGIVVLDGIEMLPPGTIGSLQSLMHNNFMPLPDGTFLTTKDKTTRESNALVFINDHCRIVGLARPHALNGDKQLWLTPEVNTTLMPFIWIRNLHRCEEQELLHNAGNSENMTRLLNLVHRLRQRSDDEGKSLSAMLTTRQLLRICRKSQSTSDSLSEEVENACLFQYLPTLAQGVLQEEMKRADIHQAINVKAKADRIVIEMTENSETPVAQHSDSDASVRKSRQVIGKVTIGDVVANVHRPLNALLIPELVFFDNPKQNRILRNMLLDFELGDSLLLIGNQGVGKNKLADKFLQMMQIPREYIQLDRDTTVNHLTSLPMIENGKIRYEDSPLVRAAREGSCLVIDEADKAPTHVTAILKALLADGDMLLSDGRRLVRTPQQGAITIHPDFRVIVLANRPGFPFMGNDFFREIGDIFACHVVPNPDEVSEMMLLRKYGPNVPEETLRKLAVAFDDLRRLVDEGVIKYPYSTRELVNIIRHMERYPEDGVGAILQNVFDFDQYSHEDKRVITKVFQKHGIPIGLNTVFTDNLGQVFPLPVPILTEKWTSGDRHTIIRSPLLPLEWRNKSTALPMHIRAPRNDRLARFEARSTVFEEKLYTFSLPLTNQLNGPFNGVMDTVSLPSGGIAIVANDAYNRFVLYTIKSDFRRYNTYEIYVPHFNFKGTVIPSVRKPAPSRCTLAPLGGEKLALYVYEDQHLHVFDLASQTQHIVVVPTETFRVSERPVEAGQGPGLWVERQNVSMHIELATEYGILIFTRRGSRTILVLSLADNALFSMDCGVYVDAMHIAAPSLWMVTQSKHIDAAREMILPELQHVSFLHHVLDIHKFPHANIAMDTYFDSVSDEQATVPQETADDDDVRFGRWHAINWQESFRIDIQRTHMMPGVHAEPSYVSESCLASDGLPLTSNTSEDRRFMYSRGTVAQLLTGSDGHSMTSLGNMCTVMSYLRTSFTSLGGPTETVANSMHVKNSNVLCNVLLREESRKGSNYLGYSQQAVMEVVDVMRSEIRHIKVTLPDTTLYAASKLDFGANELSRIEEDETEDVEEYAPRYELGIEEASVAVVRQPFHRKLVFSLCLPNGTVVLMDRTGTGNVIQVDSAQLEKSHEDWKRVSKTNRDELDISLGDEDDDEDDEDDSLSSISEEDFEMMEMDGEMEIQEDGAIEADGEITIVRGKLSKKQRSLKRRDKRSMMNRSGRRGTPQSGRQSQRNRKNTANQNNKNNSGGGSGSGAGSGEGTGSGGGGGGGQGGSGSGGTNGTFISEPGQYRDSRKLSQQGQEQIRGRIEMLKEMLKQFPYDSRLENELQQLENRLAEALEADQEVDPNSSLSKRLASLRQRLEIVEDELSRDADNIRLRTEANQLRDAIAAADRQLEEQIQNRLGKKEPNNRGGNGGPRMDRFDAEARKISQQLNKDEYKSLLEHLEMNPQESSIYLRYVESVRQQINELRSILDALYPKQQERTWLKNRDSGDLDDRKLIDGITGDRNVYKRRGYEAPDPFSFQALPKRMSFVFDVSSSMSHYAMDGRLERSLEAATMIMESFKSYEHKLSYRLRGHSGSTDDLVFVHPGKYPSNENQRLNILRAMNAHAESCASGDNTLDATRLAIREISGEESDESFVILLSDANLEQYDITPADLQQLLNMDERVNVFILFIGTMGEQANRLRAYLPSDRVFICLQSSEIPGILKKIFLSSILKLA